MVHRLARHCVNGGKGVRIVLLRPVSSTRGNQVFCTNARKITSTSTRGQLRVSRRSAGEDIAATSSGLSLGRPSQLKPTQLGPNSLTLLSNHQHRLSSGMKFSKSNHGSAGATNGGRQMLPIFAAALASIAAGAVMSVEAEGDVFGNYAARSYGKAAIHRGGAFGRGQGDPQYSGSGMDLPSSQNSDDNLQSDESSGELRSGKPRHYDVSVRALKGGRLYMEDEYVITEGGRFAAVFDGHGGNGVSRYLRDHLYQRMRYYLCEGATEVEDDGQSIAAFFSSSNLPSISSRVAALRSAFRDVDREVLSNKLLQHQGSTAVVVAMHEGDSGDRTLISANIGDSRAILSRRKRAIDLTRDHKPNDEKEKSRILALGEEIEWDGYCGVYRVKNLSLSRAIGDKYAKPAVSGEVEIKRFPVADDGDEFVVLASDGLWDVMSSQEVVNFVQKRLHASVGMEEGRSISEASRRRHMARFLANEALRRGSGDNISVVIIWLQERKSDSPSSTM